MTSTTSATPSRPGAFPSRTEAQWLLALAATLGLVGLFAAIGRLESASLATSERFVRNASETVTRFLAVAHTIVATAFVATSTRVRRARTALALAGCAALGVAVCLAFEGLGGLRAPAAGFLFYAYFVAHELRDEGWLTSRNGDAGPAAPSTTPNAARWIAWAPALVAVLVLVGVGAAGVAFGGSASKLARRLEAVPSAYRTTVGAVVLALAIVSIVLVLRRAARADGTTVLAHLARRRPRAFVTTGLLAVFLAGVALTGRLYLIVALHVVWWAVFSFDAIRRAPRPAAPPRPGTWAWVRTTPLGFGVFHGAVLLAVVGVAAAHALVARNDPSWTFARLLAGRDAFPYWTLVHVSLSWLPRT